MNMKTKSMFALLAISVFIVATMQLASADTNSSSMNSTNMNGSSTNSNGSSNSSSISNSSSGSSNSNNGSSMSNSMSSDTNSSTAQTSTTSLPFVQATGTNALYAPNFGKTNVFGPGGLFPNPAFSCGTGLTCGTTMSDAKFSGVFKEGGGSSNQFEATYVAPITYGTQQIKGHTYMVKLIDTKWNSDQAAMPTRQAEFVASKGNVAFNQIQHGATNIDRSDAPPFNNMVAMYGHVDVFDVTDGNKQVAHDIFTHVMVGKIIDSKSLFRSFQANPVTPTIVDMVVVNVPSGVQLPNNKTLTPDQAQSFTPLKTDPSLKTPPAINYQQIQSEDAMASMPMTQSTTWPVDNPTQPLFFDNIVFHDVNAQQSSDGTLQK